MADGSEMIRLGEALSPLETTTDSEQFGKVFQRRDEMLSHFFSDAGENRRQ
jgi:hypothetical protein